VSFWLDSNSACDESARFSFLGDDQGPLSETVICNGGVSIRDRRGVRAESGDLFGVLATRLADRRIGPTCLPFTFVGGYVGYCGPAGRVPDAELSVAAARYPDAMWMFADRIVVVDHLAGLTYLLAVEDGRTGVRVAADAWIVDTMRRIRDLPSHQHTGAGSPPLILPALDNRSPVERYRQLRRSRPAPYAALLRLGEVTLLSTASGSALRRPGGRLDAPPAGRRTAAADAISVNTPESVRSCLLAAMGTGIPGEPGTDLAAGLGPAPRATRLGYFGLAGGVDLSMLSPAATPRAAAFRPSAEPLVGTAEPAA